MSATGHQVSSFVTSEMTISFSTDSRSRLALGETTESDAIGCVAEYVMTDFAANGILIAPLLAAPYLFNSRHQYRCLR